LTNGTIIANDSASARRYFQTTGKVKGDKEAL
jgi:hypothetical protein